MTPRLSHLCLLLLSLALPGAAQAAITQGSGALQLVKSAKTSQSTAAMRPPEAAPLPLRTFFFAATATDNEGLESDFSAEVTLTNATSGRVEVAWDYPYTNWTVTNFTVFRGLASGAYTFAPVHAGTNLSVAFWLVRAPKTNRVVHVSTLNATGMWTAATLKGPWIQVAATNATLTNPAPSQFWRVEQPAKVFIREETF